MHPEHSSIGKLAYHLWQARGCPQGTAEQDWREAEEQLRAAQHAAPPLLTDIVDRSPQGTFPDAPPAKAEAKWKAAGATPRTSPRARPPSKSAQNKPEAER